MKPDFVLFCITIWIALVMLILLWVGGAALIMLGPVWAALLGGVTLASAAFSTIVAALLVFK